MAAPLYLDLDEVVADIPTVTISFAGAEHVLKLLSVRDWILNVKAQQEAKLGDDLAQFEATCQQIARSFPTMDIEKIRDLTMVQLDRLLDFIRGFNGTKTLDEGVAAATVQAATATPGPSAAAPDASAIPAGGDIGSENPPTAG